MSEEDRRIEMLELRDLLNQVAEFSDMISVFGRRIPSTRPSCASWKQRVKRSMPASTSCAGSWPGMTKPLSRNEVCAALSTVRVPERSKHCTRAEFGQRELSKTLQFRNRMEQQRPG